MKIILWGKYWHGGKVALCIRIVSILWGKTGNDLNCPPGKKLRLGEIWLYNKGHQKQNVWCKIFLK